MWSPTYSIELSLCFWQIWLECDSFSLVCIVFIYNAFISVSPLLPLTLKSHLMQPAYMKLSLLAHVSWNSIIIIILMSGPVHFYIVEKYVLQWTCVQTVLLLWKTCMNLAFSFHATYEATGFHTSWKMLTQKDWSNWAFNGFIPENIAAKSNIRFDDVIF